MADDNTTATTEDTTTDTAGTGTSAQTSTEGKDTTSETTQTTDNQGQERTFTQAELNAIVKKAEKKAADAAKAVIEKERADAELTEAQKEKQRADEAENRAKEAQGKLRRYSILEAARDEAEKQNLAFNPGALSDAYDLKVFDDVEVGDDGKPQGIAESIKALAKAKPHFLKPAEVAKAKAPEVDATSRGGSSLLDSPEAQASKHNLTRGF